MPELSQTQPNVHHSFINGYNVVRRSDRFWAGIYTYLATEQVLMRSMKTHGGLTRGAGMSELQRLVWVHSMPAYAHVYEAMQNFTGVSYQKRDQHKDTSIA